MGNEFSRVIADGVKEKKIGIICYRENGKWKSNDCYCSYICRLLFSSVSSIHTSIFIMHAFEAFSSLFSF